MKRSASVPQGFSLVDLLVVAAILAILAAVAIPNLLNAQVRSDVSRARTDMKGMATAMDAYMTEHSTYPPFRYSNGTSYWGYGMFGLTTPVAYMSSLPTDPFRRYPSEPVPFYELVTGGSKALPGSGGRGNPGTPLMPRSDWIPWPKDMYLMASAGPDTSDQTTTQRFPVEFGWNSGHNKYEPCLVYDASNGSVSMGDIYRWVCPVRYDVIFEVGYDPGNGIDPTDGAYLRWRSGGE